MHIVADLDIQTPHEKDQIMRRVYEEKENKWIFLCFANDCIIQTKNGMELAHAGDCFIKSPGFIEYHYAPKESEQGFINDWLHVKSETMGEILKELKLPVNILIRTQHPELMRNSIQRILTEKRNLHPFSAQYISNIVEHILIRLARAAAESSYGNLRRYDEELLSLRIKLLESIEKPWTISEMAETVGLSNSRFSVLYKKRFGLSPNEDLVNMRVDKARLLLLSTNMKLHHIAGICGFKNEYYFSRVFKEKENLTPGSFRRDS